MAACVQYIEFYSNPYRNAYYDLNFKSQLPIPPVPRGEYTEIDFKNDNWKWSIFAQKTFSKNIKVLGQIARDHMRHDIIYNAQRDEEEIFTRNHEFYWALKLECSF